MELWMKIKFYGDMVGLCLGLPLFLGVLVWSIMVRRKYYKDYIKRNRSNFDDIKYGK